jgi:DNA polymerase I - 3''-5'' exonuclease and polymerase domains
MISTSKTPTLVTMVTLQDIEALLPTLPIKDYCLDLETTGLNPRQHKLVALMFGTEKRVCILDCRPYNDLREDEKTHWREVITALCEKVCTRRCVGHNLKFDTLWLRTLFGINLTNVCDTQVQEQIIHSVPLGGNEKSSIRVNLGDTAYRYGLYCPKEARSWFVGLDLRDDWYKPFPQEQLEYMVRDITVPLQVARCQLEELIQKELVSTAHIENWCVPAIAAMESNGCRVDVPRWRGIVERKTQEQNALEVGLQLALTPYILSYRYAKHQAREEEREARNQERDVYLAHLQSTYDVSVHGKWGSYKKVCMKQWTQDHTLPNPIHYDTGPINLGSHLQLKIALESLGVSVSSTSRVALERVHTKDDTLSNLLKWKEVAKFVSSFGEKLLSKVELDGRIYPSYNQIGASTGRMSSEKPNWQQLPARMKGDDNVRECIIASPGYKLITTDLPNIEMRILAELSLDRALLDVFKSGRDAHSQIACVMFGLEHTEENYKEVSKEMSPYGKKYRDIAKTINFGLCYGMGVVGLSDILRVPPDEAKQAMDTYFETFPQVQEWLESSSEHAVRVGYSTTIGGRKRFYKHIEEPDKGELEWEEYLAARSFFYKWFGVYSRAAKNAPIQGTNADILKYALALLHTELPHHAKLVTVVHDEVVLEAPCAYSEQMGTLLSTCLYQACRTYLKTVALSVDDLTPCISDYWKKGD